MTVIHEIPGGTVEIRDRDAIPEKHARRVRALSMAMGADPAVRAQREQFKGRDLQVEPLREEEIDTAEVMAQIADSMPLIDQLSDATIIARLKSWTFTDEDGHELPVAAESLGEIPEKAYEALKELCADTVRNIELSTEPDPDPKALTPDSTD